MTLIVVTFGACRAQVADLGGPGACAVDAGAPASCRYTGPYNDGSGYFSGTPHYCGDPDGVTLTSLSDIETAIVGVWTACGSSGPYPGSAGAGVQFSSDGKFVLLGQDASKSGFTPSTDPAGAGTFTIVDASSSLGPGTFQMRFATANGGVSLVQVVVQGSPSRLRFLAPMAADFVPAQTWAFRASVCGPGAGPAATCLSDEGLLAGMQGRWLWCSGFAGWSPILAAGDPAPTPSPVGIEVTGTQWTLLFEDTSGAVVADPGKSGSLQLGSDGTNGAMWKSDGLTLIAPTSPILDACGRTLFPEPTLICQPGQSDPCPIDDTQSAMFVHSTPSGS